MGGNVGIGTTSPDEKLEVKGILKVSNTGAGDLPLLLLEDSNGSNDRPGIQFTNNTCHYIVGDDVGSSNEQFGFYSKFSSTRTNDAVLKVHGKATSHWGTYISFTHDGTDGFINTDIGNIVIDPAGALDIHGQIYQNGSMLHADYVFELDYKLESIDKHSEFMWKEKHLPAIPKAKVNEQGQEVVEIGSHRKGIVEELEKAHIYIEQLHKRNKELEARLDTLELLLTHTNKMQQGELK